MAREITYHSRKTEMIEAIKELCSEITAELEQMSKKYDENIYPKDCCFRAVRLLESVKGRLPSSSITAMQKLGITPQPNSK